MDAPLRLQSRGPLRHDAPSIYVERAVDHALQAALREGGLIVVLGPPGSGKSSLMARQLHLLSAWGPGGQTVQMSLRGLQAGRARADLLQITQEIGHRLGLPAGFPAPPSAGVDSGPGLTPAGRFAAFLAPLAGEPLTLALDDFDAASPETQTALLDALRSFFAPVPDGDPPLLAVCLGARSDVLTLLSGLGVSRQAPWLHIVPLGALSRAEVDPFAPALHLLVDDVSPADRPLALRQYLDALHGWSGGMPQLMQQLCLDLVVRGAPRVPQTPADHVAALVERLYGDGAVVEAAPADSDTASPLHTVAVALRDALLHDLSQAAADGDARGAAPLFSLWRRLWRGETPPADPDEVSQRALWLAGVATCPFPAPLSADRGEPATVAPPAESGVGPSSAWADRGAQRASDWATDLQDELGADLEEAWAAERAERGEDRPVQGPVSRLVTQLLNDDWMRAVEARQILRGMVQATSPSVPPSGSAAGGQVATVPLRGGALRSVYGWAVRNTQRLSALEVRALLIHLDAARQEAEARHQQGTAATQREARDRGALRATFAAEKQTLSRALSRAERRVHLLFAGCVLLSLITLALAGLLFFIRLRRGSLS